MTYYNEDQLYRYFEKAIERESKTKAEKLKKEINYIYHREMKKITEDLTLKKSLELSKKLKEEQINYQEQLNQIGIGYDEKLIAERAKLSTSIFTEVTKKLIKYVQSSAYVKQMTEKLEELKKHYHGHTLSFRIASHDDLLEKLITSYCTPDHYVIHKTQDILFGGFFVEVQKENIEIDETIDTKFEEQKAWFYQNSKLFIRY